MWSNIHYDVAVRIDSLNLVGAGTQRSIERSVARLQLKWDHAWLALQSLRRDQFERFLITPATGDRVDLLLTFIVLIDLNYPTDRFRSERIKLHVVEWCLDRDCSLRCGAHIRRCCSRWRWCCVIGARGLLCCRRTSCW